jgi:hypothetical protein
VYTLTLGTGGRTLELTNATELSVGAPSTFAKQS